MDRAENHVQNTLQPTHFHKPTELIGLASWERTHCKILEGSLILLKWHRGGFGGHTANSHAPHKIFYQWAWIQQPTSALLKAVVLSSLAFLMIASERQGTDRGAWSTACTVAARELANKSSPSRLRMVGSHKEEGGCHFFHWQRTFQPKFLATFWICGRLLRWTESESWSRYLYIYMSGGLHHEDTGRNKHLAGGLWIQTCACLL